MDETIGGCTLLEPLGAGGAGRSFRARDTRSGRTVVVRLLDATAAHVDRRERLRASLEEARQLSHPNIASIYDVGEWRDGLYFTQEFVPGQTLAQLAADRSISARRALGYAADVSDGLAEAHSRGMQHGYLTLNHVVVTPKGWIKIMDFGFAEWTQSAQRTGPRSDLQALGLMLADMLPPPQASAARAGRQDPLEHSARRLSGDLAAGKHTEAAAVAADCRAMAGRIEALRAAGPAPPGVSALPPPASRGWGLLVASMVVVALLVYVLLGGVLW